MLAAQRQELILEQVRQDGSVRVTELLEPHSAVGLSAGTATALVADTLPESA